MTLLETTLAVGLAALTLLLLVAVIASGARLMGRSAEVAAATEVGREFLEAVRQAGYGTLPEPPARFDGRAGTAGGEDFPPAPWPSSEVGGRTFKLDTRVEWGTGATKFVTVDVYYSSSSFVTLQTALHP